MRIKCPNCDSEIPAKNINIDTGLAKCACGEVFAIRGVEKPGAVQGEVAAEKPLGTNITAEEIPGKKLEIRFPNFIGNVRNATLGIWAGMIFLIIFTLIWVVPLWGPLIWALIRGEHIFIAGLIMQAPFMLIGLGLVAMVLYFLVGTYRVEADPERVVVIRGLFGINYRKKLAMELINKITVDDAYRSQENVKALGHRMAIYIECGTRTQKIGVGFFTEQELEWVASKIRRFVRAVKGGRI